MRELHVVAVSEDGHHLVLANSADAGRGGFRIAIDERLQAALRGDLGGPGERDRRPESALSPREIQARLRAGDSPEEVARAAGVALARIERFSGPVLSERTRVVDEARAARLERQRRGLSALPLGEAVDAALGDVAGLKPGSVEWTAWRRENATWVVRLTYTARGRTRSAEWGWAPSRREVTALDNAAAALAYVAPAAPARRRTRSAAKLSTARPPTAGHAATDSPPPSARSTARTRTVRKSAAGSTTTPVARPGPRKGARPASTSAATRADVLPVRATPAATGRSAALDGAAGTAPEQGSDTAPDAGKRGSGGRTSVPSWADVLLGTTPRGAPDAGRADKGPPRARR